MSSVAYWYASKPTRVAKPPKVAQRLPVHRDNFGHWLHNPKIQTTTHKLRPNTEKRRMKARWKKNER